MKKRAEAGTRSCARLSSAVDSSSPSEKNTVSMNRLHTVQQRVASFVSHSLVQNSVENYAAKIMMHCPILLGHESSKYERMMDCAYVEANEPQMIDIAFIKSKCIRITRFLKVTDFTQKTSTSGFYNEHAMYCTLENIIQLLVEYTRAEVCHEERH
ncbi:hypothetical protein JOB18_018828 [Solea senegalensis]|uniref:Uncharacterized protein n=1 Tax=Solea senegalensis TaxID=28829 RepID=A0AAV6T656_SOLSE|nr:hypothetical protein JOB18_018828 [Solea senegalensis]